MDRIVEKVYCSPFLYHHDVRQVDLQLSLLAKEKLYTVVEPAVEVNSFAADVDISLNEDLELNGATELV